MNHINTIGLTKSAKLQHFVSLGGSPQNAPLFSIHPSGGDVGIYRKVTRCVRSVQSIGIQSKLIAGSQSEYDSIAQMGQVYARLINEHQPSGPIRLLGFSVGGFIANSIAAELDGLGREISFMGLIDSDLRWLFEPKLFRRELGLRLEQVSTNFQNSGLLVKIPKAKLKVDVQEIVESCLNGMLPSAIMQDIHDRGHVAHNEADTKKFQAFVFRFVTHCRMINAFEPKHVSTALHLWWPSDGKSEVSQKGQLWRKFTDGICSDSIVGESHYSMMKMPAAKSLAAEIDSAIESSDVK